MLGSNDISVSSCASDKGGGDKKAPGVRGGRPEAAQ